MTEAPRSDHFPLFDALRGLAAIAVVTYHGVYLPALYNGIGGGGWGWIWRYVMHLDVAGPIFLGVSGFLLYSPFVAPRHAGRPVPALGRYGLRRLLRIVPGYWFALTVLTLWFWWQPPGFSEVRSPEGDPALLWLRPDLLGRHGDRRHRPGVDALRRGGLLRRAAAVGAADAAPGPLAAV